MILKGLSNEIVIFKKTVVSGGEKIKEMAGMLGGHTL
jgi:hypothetical protein